jgi:hypothetical protein
MFDSARLAGAGKVKHLTRLGTHFWVPNSKMASSDRELVGGVMNI